jgi:hypothetical protein
MRIYESELGKLNRLPEAKAYHKLPEENGGGYLAMLEIFHVLHCLVSHPGNYVICDLSRRFFHLFYGKTAALNTDFHIHTGRSAQIHLQRT